MMPTNLPPEVPVLLHELKELPEPMQRVALKAWCTTLEMIKASRVVEQGVCHLRGLSRPS